MENYYVEYVKALDTVLLALAVCLSVLVVGYAFAWRIQLTRRRRKLKGILENLQKMALPGKELSAEQCSVFMRNVGLARVMDVHKGTTGALPQELVAAIPGCVRLPEEAAKIEKTARGTLNKWKRIEALIMLGHINSPNAVEILKEGADSKDEDISYFSIISLGHIKNGKTAALLLDLIKKRKISGQRVMDMFRDFSEDASTEIIPYVGDEDPATRFWAVKMLSRLKPGNREYIAKVAGLTKDASADVRSAACEFLGELKDKAHVPSVEKCLDDRAWSVRSSAANALGKISGEECISKIFPLLGDSVSTVRNSVKAAISPHLEKALDKIEAALRKGSVTMQKASVELLEESGYDKKVLTDVLFPDPEIKKRAVGLLDAMIKAGAHFGLESVLKDQPEGDRDEILNVISSLDKELAEHIKLKITDKLVDI